MSLSFHRCKYIESIVFFIVSFYCCRVFDEVSANLNEIIQRQLTPLPNDPIGRLEVTRSDTVSSCSSTSQCSPNGSKKKCWFNQCLECHRNNQCVRDGKLRCNRQTFQCEAGRYIGAFVTRELANQKVIGDFENQEESITELQTGSVPNLISGIRYIDNKFQGTYL